MLKIAGVTVKSPSELKVGRYDITKSNRSASGKMMMELIATKRRVDCVWKMLPDNDLKLIIDTITANKPFFSLEYPDAGSSQTMTCYAGHCNQPVAHEKWYKILGRS